MKLKIHAVVHSSGIRAGEKKREVKNRFPTLEMKNTIKSGERRRKPRKMCIIGYGDLGC